MLGFNVLMYHEIVHKQDFDYNEYKGIKVQQDYQDVLPPVLFAYLEEFEKQIKYLFDEGYVTLTLKDVIDFYYNDKNLLEKSVLLTFDDMYKSILTRVYPILKKYNFHAIGFVVKDWIFDEKQDNSKTKSVCLSKEELEQMRDVFEYANHTKSLHTRMDGRAALETIDKISFLKDLRSCEEFVSTKNAFAYPFGVYTDENIDWLKEEGFMLAFTSEEGKNTKETNPYKLHRDGILLNYNLEKFKSILNYN
ncbi:polysaccharide deacetylase family protein [Clostridium sp. D2Q-11]|uniref:Polysaccharide deacetylase family protein n=1 Tax=Anaeromonas frigoriresistens TaxID=2683708 RepID=A0A942Z6E4_9FIRM|nr:polysaccharide deacetylase family protein [Anaeromonas frigoriresistens]MBS4538386.1 polysaccharide deacetylase family protein [Anaeromonas frigoriresistens]